MEVPRLPSLADGGWFRGYFGGSGGEDFVAWRVKNMCVWGLKEVLLVSVVGLIGYTSKAHVGGAFSTIP